MNAAERKVGIMDLLMLSCTLIWGANFSFIKVALRGWDPMVLNLFRLFVASSAMILFLKFSGELKRVDRADGLRLAAGTAVFLMYQFSYLFGIKETLTWKASILNGMMPIFVAIIAFIIKDEIPSLIVWAAVTFSFLGIVLLMWGNVDLSRIAESEHILGDALSLLAAVLWAAYTIIMKPLLKKYTPILISTYPIMLTTIAFIPLTIPYMKNQAWMNIGLLPFLAAAGSGLLSIAFGNVVWYYSVRMGGNIRTAIYSNLIPVWAIVIAIIFLGERMLPLEVAGAGLVIAGVALSKFKIRMNGLSRFNKG